MNKINWTRKASKQLGKINKADQIKVYDAAQALAYMPNVQNIKSLTRLCTKFFETKVRQGENSRGSGVYGL